MRLEKKIKGSGMSLNKKVSDEKNLKDVNGGIGFCLNLNYDSEEIDNSKKLVNKNGGNKINFFSEEQNAQKEKMDTLIINFKKDGTMSTKK